MCSKRVVECKPSAPPPLPTATAATATATLCCHNHVHIQWPELISNWNDTKIHMFFPKLTYIHAAYMFFSTSAAKWNLSSKAKPWEPRDLDTCKASITGAWTLGHWHQLDTNWQLWNLYLAWKKTYLFIGTHISSKPTPHKQYKQKSTGNLTLGW